MEDAEVTVNDEFVDKVDPDPGLGSLIRISWYYVGFVVGIGIFEELEDDVRVVKRFALISESGDQSFRIEGCSSAGEETGASRWREMDSVIR